MNSGPCNRVDTGDLHFASRFGFSVAGLVQFLSYQWFEQTNQFSELFGKNSVNEVLYSQVGLRIRKYSEILKGIPWVQNILIIRVLRF